MQIRIEVRKVAESLEYMEHNVPRRLCYSLTYESGVARMRLEATRDGKDVHTASPTTSPFPEYVQKPIARLQID